MWNIDLLKSCAQTNKPIVLKRGNGASTFEWLATAVKLQKFGCSDIILCERGLPSVDDCMRNAIDISTLFFLMEESPLPVWIDVSHSSGDPRIALAMILRIRQLGINGIMAEVHTNPSAALCDGYQAISISKLMTLSREK